MPHQLLGGLTRAKKGALRNRAQTFFLVQVSMAPPSSIPSCCKRRRKAVWSPHRSVRIGWMEGVQKAERPNDMVDPIYLHENWEYPASSGAGRNDWDDPEESLQGRSFRKVLCLIPKVKNEACRAHDGDVIHIQDILPQPGISIGQKRCQRGRCCFCS